LDTLTDVAPAGAPAEPAAGHPLAPFGIVLPPGYRWTRIPWTWAKTDCQCGGSGEILVNSLDDGAELWDEENEGIWYPQPCDCLDGPPETITSDLDRVLRRLRQLGRDVRARQARVVAQWQRVFAEIGPRDAGTTYFDGFWHSWLTVESISITAVDGDPEHLTWSMRVSAPSGTTWTTRTPWNPSLGDRSAPASALRPDHGLPDPAPAPAMSLPAATSTPSSRRRSPVRFLGAARHLARRLFAH
jgi:hypothetical protein